MTYKRPLKIEVIHGDSTESGYSCDLYLTDPPYKDYQSNRPTASEKQKKISAEQFNWLALFLQLEFSLKQHHHAYIFADPLCVFDLHANLVVYNTNVKEHYPEMGCLEYKNTLVWLKNNHGSGDLKGNYAPQYETISYISRGKRKELNPPRRSNVLPFPKVPNTKFTHGTSKPVALLKKLIEASTDQGDIVYDPYGGSMSTAIACIETCRSCVILEIDRDHFERGVERIKQANPGTHDILIRG